MDADVEKRFKRIDRRLHGITTLIRMGAKVLVRTAQQQAEISRLQKEDRQAIHPLIEAQIRSEARMGC